MRRTLRRRTDYRPIEREDLKWVWAAYKKGALASMGPPFIETDMASEDFREAFETEIVANYNAAWTLFAETPRGFVPAGLALGFFSHHDTRRAPFMILGDLIWFPWASTRNRIEAAVGFFNRVRHEIAIVEYARQKDKPFFMVMMRHGIMRQVGTSMNVYVDEPAAVYETRRSTS